MRKMTIQKPNKTKSRMSEAESLLLAIRAIDYLAKASPDSTKYAEASKILRRLYKRTLPIKISSAKQKGRRLQNEIREDLVGIGINPGDILSTPSGVNGCDLYLSPAARRRFPFGVEAKNQEEGSLNFWKAWSQASRNAEKERLYPMLVLHRNNAPKLVVFEWSLFLRLIAGDKPAER